MTPAPGIRTPASTAVPQRHRQRHTGRRTRTAIVTTTAAVIIGTLAVLDRGDSTSQTPPIVTAPTGTDATTIGAPESTTSAPAASTTGPPATPTSVTTATALDTTPPATGLEPFVPEPSNDGGTVATYAYRIATANAWSSVKLLPGGKSFLVGRDGATPFRIHDIETGSLVREFSSVTGFGPKEFDDSGTRYFDGESLWDVTTGDRVGRYGDAAYGAAFSPDGAYLAVLHVDGSVELVDAVLGERIWHNRAGILGNFGQHWADVRFAEDVSDVFVRGYVFDMVTGDAEPGAVPSETVPDVGFWDPGAVTAVDAPRATCDPTSMWDGCDISDDGMVLAMLGDDGTIRIWRTER